MLKTDLKNKVIIFLLLKNSKFSLRDLSRISGFNKNTILNRIDSLFDSGVIRSYLVSVDYSFFDLKEYNIFILFKKLDEVSISKFISSLEESRFVSWIGRCFGKYDLKVSILVRNQTDLKSFLDFLNCNFGDIISEIEILDVVYKYKNKGAFDNDFFNFFDEGFEVSSFANLVSFDKKYLNVSRKVDVSKAKFSSCDLEILRTYVNNFKKKSFAEMALECSISIDKFVSRIKYFESIGLIGGYSIVIDGNKIGKIWCLVLIKYNYLKIDSVLSYFKRSKDITSYIFASGKYNISVTFFANSIEELYFKLNLFRSKFSEGIFNFEYLIFFDFYKFPKMPEIVLDI